MAKRIAAVITCVDTPELAELSLRYLRENSVDSKLYLVDNGSEVPLPQFEADEVVRYDTNIGANAIFHRMLPLLEENDHEFVAYLHCDLIVRKKAWDKYIAESVFDCDPDLALCGFVGSTEMDILGGRGGGTHVTFVGGTYVTNTGREIVAAPASHHGARVTAVKAAAVLDHCSMIFRVSDLKTITPQEGNYAPGHFYDRIISCELLEKGKHIALVPVECDHFSGGTAEGTKNRNDFYDYWLQQEGITYTHDNPDLALYVESERRFLSKWRDTGFIPLRVNPDYSVTHFYRRN